MTTAMLLSFSKPVIFLKFVGNISQPHGFQSPPGGIAGVRIPSLQSVEAGFKIFKFISIKMAAQGFNIAPLFIFDAGHEFGLPIKGKAGLGIKIVGKMDHVPVPSLKRPDGVIQVPYFSAELDTVKEGKILTSDGIEKFGL